MRHSNSDFTPNLKTVVPAIGRNDFPRRREPILTVSRRLSIGSRFRGNDGYAAVVSRNSRLKILPTFDFGRSSRNSMYFGFLYAVSCSLQ